MKSKQKTPQSMNVFSKVDSDCLPCQGTTTHRVNKHEYNVVISTDSQQSTYYISATIDSNTYAGDEIDQRFLSKIEAEQFVNQTFNKFRCF